VRLSIILLLTVCLSSINTEDLSFLNTESNSEKPKYNRRKIIVISACIVACVAIVTLYYYHRRQNNSPLPAKPQTGPAAQLPVFPLCTIAETKTTPPSAQTKLPNPPSLPLEPSPKLPTAPTPSPQLLTDLIHSDPDAAKALELQCVNDVWSIQEGKQLGAPINYEAIYDYYKIIYHNWGKKHDNISYFMEKRSFRKRDNINSLFNFNAGTVHAAFDLGYKYDAATKTWQQPD
jgi:hypothetical protein